MKAQGMRWFTAAGVDFHVAATLLLRGWSLVAGAVMLFAIPITLNQQQQGYYFTFASLLGLQIFFELGLNQVITQVVSKEIALLSDAGANTPDLDRMRSIVRLLKRWYAVAACLFFLVAFAVGALVFGQDGTLPLHDWVGPWATLTAVTAVNLYLSPLMAVAEGTGQVGHVARVRLVQSILGYGLTWAGLFAGLGLWAVPLNVMVASLCTAGWLRRGDHGMRRFDSRQAVDPSRAIDWRREVLPFQWRIAASWMSGYLMYQLFTPLIFLHLGPIVAGRLGMSIAIFTALQSIGVSWISARLPQMTRLISLGDRPKLKRLFLLTLTGAFGSTVLGCVSVVAIVAAASWADSSWISRLADLPTLFTIAIGTLGNLLVFALAAYMRAHGEEPMLPPSAAAAVLTLAAVYVASFYGTFLTMLAHTVVTLGIVLPWTLWLFKQYWTRA